MTVKWVRVLAIVVLATQVLAGCAQPAAPQTSSDDAAKIATLQAQLADAQKGTGAQAQVATLEAQLAAVPTPVPLPISLDEFKSAKINWRQIVEAAPDDPPTIQIAVVKHPFTESLVPLLPVFEQLTGLKVAYSVLPQAEYWPKLQVDLSSGSGLIDIFMTGPELNWPYVPAGWTEPLDKYLNDPKLTDLAWYDQKDFYEAAWNANRVDVAKIKQGGGYGEGDIYALPVTYEIMSLTYRKDLLEEAGVKVDAGWPRTWQDVYDAAKATTKTKADGTKQYGIVARGHRAWPSMFGGYSNIFYSYGANDFDEMFNPTVNSKEGIEATKMWVDMMQCCAPPGVTDMQFFQVKQAFAEGQAAMVIDCDWFAAATYEDPKVSKVAGKLGYANTPPGPDGKQIQDLWFWSLGMTSKGYHKEASWLFIQWATSKPVLLASARDYQNWNPPRQSTWDDPAIVKKTEGWSNYRAVVEANQKLARVPHRVNPMAGAALDAWWGNVQDAILGKVTSEEALNNAAKEMRNIMDKAGYYK